MSHDVNVIFSPMGLRLISKSQQRVGLTFLKTTIMFQITVCNLQGQEDHNMRPEKGSDFDQDRQWGFLDMFPRKKSNSEEVTVRIFILNSFLKC